MSTSGSQSHSGKRCMCAQSCPTPCNPMGVGFPTGNTGVGCHFLPQGNLSNPGIEATSPASPASAGRFFTTEPPRINKRLVSERAMTKDVLQ